MSLDDDISGAEIAYSYRPTDKKTAIDLAELYERGGRFEDANAILKGLVEVNSGRREEIIERGRQSRTLRDILGTSVYGVCRFGFGTASAAIRGAIAPYAVTSTVTGMREFFSPNNSEDINQPFAIYKGFLAFSSGAISIMGSLAYFVNQEPKYLVIPVVSNILSLGYEAIRHNVNLRRPSQDDAETIEEVVNSDGANQTGGGLMT